MPAEAKRWLLMELRRERELGGDLCAAQESRRCVHVTLAIAVTLAGVPLPLLRDDWRRRRKERVRRGWAGGGREGSGGTERGGGHLSRKGGALGRVGGEGVKTSFNLGQLPAGAGARVTEHPRLKKHTRVVLGIQRN